MRNAVAVLVLGGLVGCQNAASVSDSNLPNSSQVRATLQHGHRVHVMPKQHVKNAATVPANAQLTYYGGHVISNLKPVAVFWGSSVNAQVVSYMPGFYTAMVNSPYMDWLTEYNTPATGGTNQTIGRGTYGGTFTIAPANTATALQDADIQTEIGAQITSGALPAPDANTLYMVHFPPGVTISQGGQGSCSAFCAYHGTFLRNGQDIFYGVIPDFGPGSGCDTGCGTNAMLDNVSITASHEAIEATTDAEVGLATTNGPPLAWYDSNNGEIGDICAYVLNGTLPGTSYMVQGEWSNVHKGCIVTATACTPSCGSNVCGSDGCGGFCGTCPTGQSCSSGQCVAGCTPSCGNNVCGSDGCGGSCGTCPSGQTCTAGQCTGGCTPSCGTNVCGSDGCGGSCGTCPSGQACTNGQCVAGCTPDCTGKQCGDDGCGGSCGTCSTGSTCDSNGQCQSSGGTCAHPICAPGSALGGSCDVCAGSVCSADPYCCTTAWDSICVGEVGSVCGCLLYTSPSPRD